jgi:phosphoenolpyruvate synthase/pyruvate phosphate dikinase
MKSRLLIPSEYNLYWEDVVQGFIYAELEDKAWKLAEKIFQYKKTKSIYIFHNGKLGAYFSIKDSKKEARVGQKFYGHPKNINTIIKLKKLIYDEVIRSEVNFKKISLNTLPKNELSKTLITYLNLYLRSLQTHYLTQPQFFENFGITDTIKYRKGLNALARARLAYTRKAWTKALALCKETFKALAHRNELTVAQMENFSLEEITKNTLNKKMSLKRKAKFALICQRHKTQLITGKPVDKLIKEFDTYKNIKQVIGTTGNPGKVTAKAFVVKNEHLNLSKLPTGMKKGMVLVVQNAWPEFSKYYRLASAIITNEGGITSHGVVVAREYGIPCVVGTRIATKVFKTGDILEIDGSQGSAILEQSNY